jgi:RNA polymerase sigma-70 factor (ECF subfamily)
VALSSAAVLDAVSDRRDLTGYCSRILGSAFEADDAVQETMVRAWTRRDTFEGRSSARSWVYRIATNVCLDMLRGRQRRAVPIDLAGLEVLPHDQDLRPAGDPADAVAVREEVHQAFVIALQALPARQRSVLILRDVLRWSTPEVAELLDTTPASVNSALQRARATLAARQAAGASVPSADVLDDEHRSLLAGLAAALESYDVSSLVTLVRDDASASTSVHAAAVPRCA